MGCYIIAEAGINHNGDIDTARNLMDAAKDAGADCVKFQKRTLPDCIPEAERSRLRDTPWGQITYLEYKEHLEFSRHKYDQINSYARRIDIDWTVSVWDVGAVDFVRKNKYDVPFLKIPSAKITDYELLQACKSSGKRIVASTGMSTYEELINVRKFFYYDDLTLLHCVSSYPADPKDVNLALITCMKEWFPEVTIGYSGHERGTQITIAAVALGAAVIERHITLDRTMWGTDQAASLEPHAFKKMVRDIRIVESAMGDGIKRVVDAEIETRKKLRGCS